MRQQWEKTQLTRVRDSVDLRMFRPDGSEVGSLQEGKLSDGQRNTAVLAILLARGDGPLLIDQPEDELDAAFIYQQLVPLLREVKQKRQIGADPLTWTPLGLGRSSLAVALRS